MGTWGPGLYANDLAKDLKSTITSVLRLPLEPDELVTLLQDSYQEASSQEDDEEYTSFWLALADQFHKKGVHHSDLFARAIDMIDSGSDLERPERLEMSPTDRKKREKTLQELRAQLVTPPPEKPRKTLSKPQPLIMNPGDLLLFPTFAHNNCINPYSKKWSHPQESWRAVYIVRATHVFGYLACYMPVVLSPPLDMEPKPDSSALLAASDWKLRRPGTCSKPHFTRMQLELVEQLPVDEQQLASHFPTMRDGRYQAVNDISISNSLTGAMGNDGTIERLGEIVAR